MKTLILIALTITPYFGNASTKYVCGTSPDNMIGIGLEFNIEILDMPGYAVLIPYTTGKDEKQGVDWNLQKDLKKFLQVTIENPAQAMRTGDVFHISANVTQLTAGGPGAEKGVMEVDLDVVAKTLSFSSDTAKPKTTLPCR